MKIKKYSRFVVLFTIVVMQVLLIIYWGTQKENMYWDEFYTLEKAHYISDSTPVEHYIDDDDAYKLETWLPISMVQDTLIVDENSTVLTESPIRLLSKIFKTNSYMFLLNILESIFFMGKFSLWPSIILNIVLFIFHQIVLFLMCRRLAKDDSFAIATCAFYGFSSICISMTIFIRFYMFAALLVTLFTYAHLLYYEEDSASISGCIKRIAYLVLAGVSLLLAYNNAQYTVIFACFLVIPFSVLLLLKKGKRRFFRYSLPIYGGGIVYLYTQTNYLQVLFDFKNAYDSSEGALTATLDVIAEFKFSYLPVRIEDMMHNFGKYMFGSYYMMLIFLIIAIVVFAFRLIKKNHFGEESLFLPYVYVVFIGTALYLLFFTVFGLYEQIRYISFVFPELALLNMALLYKTFNNKKIRYGFAFSLIVLMMLSVNLKGKVDMLYSGDRENIERIREFDCDSFVLYAGAHTTFITYQAGFVLNPNDEFYVYSPDIEGSVEHLEGQLRDKMILVGYFGTDMQDVISMFEKEGYTVEWLANTYQYSFHSVTMGNVG